MNDILKEESDKAIEKGNEFNGYIGVSPNDLTKEQLIMICNVLYDNIHELRHDILQLHKRLL